jgi:hypothetical protein
MRVISTLVFATSALACVTAQGQFVKGNEAAQSGKKLEMPPVPSSVSKVCEANAKCHAGAWRMVETKSGLMECTEPWARAGSCRASTYGSQKLARVWVVKRNGEWAQCQYPDLTSKCTPVFARPPANLPFDAVQ